MGAAGAGLAAGSGCCAGPDPGSRGRGMPLASGPLAMSRPLPPKQSAEEAGLRYVSDDRPGLRRVRSGRGFRYLRADGSRVADATQLAWIKSLAIPPAWEQVWICSDRRGHLQATGRDRRGRKVYRYHPSWRQSRDQMKYERLLDFGRALPRIRGRVRRDLARRGLPREKVLAVVVRLLDSTLLRIGNEAYAQENRSFGLTTLRNRHARVGRSTIRLRFIGKGGRLVEVSVNDRRLARVVGRLQDLPGQELFQYLDEQGERHPIDSEEVNAYLRKAGGEDFTAKDFRTWAGTVAAASALRGLELPERQAPARSHVLRAIEQVADQLGNTPAVSRSAYVHPAVIDAYLDGDLRTEALREVRRERGGTGDRLASLRVREAALISLLRRRARVQAASASKRSRARR